MATIVQTDGAIFGVQALVQTTLNGTLDTFAYRAGQGQILVLRNPTAGALSPGRALPLVWYCSARDCNGVSRGVNCRYIHKRMAGILAALLAARCAAFCRNDRSPRQAGPGYSAWRRLYGSRKVSSCHGCSGYRGPHGQETIE